MKIGVALSGCDIGGISAHSVLEELAVQGLEIAMISSCCIPSVPALLYAYGCDEIDKHARQFLHDMQALHMDTAIGNLSADFPLGHPRGRVPLAINAVNVSDGKIITFTNDYAFHTDRLTTFQMDSAYNSLSSTISLEVGPGCYSYNGCSLCDFCVWYGCPVYPLKMAGLERIISIAFLPQLPCTPYEVLVGHMLEATAGAADLHIPIDFPKAAELPEYIEIATRKVKSRIDEILSKILF